MPPDSRMLAAGNPIILTTHLCMLPLPHHILGELHIKGLPYTRLKGLPYTRLSKHDPKQHQTIPNSYANLTRQPKTAPSHLNNPQLHQAVGPVNDLNGDK